MNTQETCEARALITYLLAAGCSLSVHDGEETTIRRSVDPSAVFDALATTDADTLTAHFPDGNAAGFWLIYGNGPGELIADHDVTPGADAAWRYVQDTAVPADYRCG